jgi:predicted RNA-binding protein (virulence factor B family)
MNILKMSMEEKYKPGQKVDLIILRETALGYVAQINGVDEGLLYHNEVFERLYPKDVLPGYINRIRPDGAIDLLMQPFGNFGAEELGEKILKALRLAGGFLPITDKSSAEEVYDLFGVSKKKFKIALGGIYKMRLIKIDNRGIELLPGK